jgi:hypothetical protein
MLRFPLLKNGAFIHAMDPMAKDVKLSSSDFIDFSLMIRAYSELSLVNLLMALAGCCVVWR